MAHAASIGRNLLPTAPQTRRVFAQIARWSFAARGVISTLLGIFALQAAHAGRSVSKLSSESALRFLRDQPLGTWILGAIAVGLITHALFRAIQALRDTEEKGSDWKGLATRAGYLASGIFHATLFLATLRLIAGYGARGRNERETGAQLLQLPGGDLLLGIVGVICLVFAGAQVDQAIRQKFLQELEPWKLGHRAREILCRLGQWGHGARAVTWTVIGFFLVKAAWDHDPGEVRGLGGALNEVLRQSHGQAGLMLVALGFIAFGAYCFALARYRRVEL